MASLLQRRPTTRRPFPLSVEVRHQVVLMAYRLLGGWLARLFRRSVTREELRAAAILLLKPCCLGDVVFSTALVRELRRAFPGARIVYATGRHSRPAIDGNPHVDEVLDTGAVGSGRYGPGDYLRLVRRLRAGRFDACFVLERSAVLAVLPLLAGIPTRIGIDSGGRGFSLGVAVPTRPARPESELYLDLLRAIGGRPASGALEYVPSSSAIGRVEGLLEERSLRLGSFVVVHCAGGTNPGMALLRKRWPVESFRALAERILEAGASVVLVGAPEDREVSREVAAAGKSSLTLTLSQRERGFGGVSQGERAAPAEGSGLKGGSRDEGLKPRGSGPADFSPPVPSPGFQAGAPARIVDLIGRLSLDEVAALARRAAVYVGNDSGPTHLAEAAGANVVMLFGPSDPIVYGPRTRRAVAVSAGLWCSPCFEDGRVAPCANVICVRAISVERVWREVRPYLPSAVAAR